MFESIDGDGFPKLRLQPEAPTAAAVSHGRVVIRCPTELFEHDQEVFEGSRDDATSSLMDLGISRDESSLWQKLAKIPESEFERRRKS